MRAIEWRAESGNEATPVFSPESLEKPKFRVAFADQIDNLEAPGFSDPRRQSKALRAGSAIMSCMRWPRFHLGGAFFTVPSTVVNDAALYKEEVTRPSPWQDPKGLYRFRFVDVKALGAVDADGGFVDNDPIIGATANSLNLPTPAKIVDLDVYQQGVSTIFGFQLQLSFSALVNLIGSMEPCCCNALWWNRVLPTRGWRPWDV